MNLQMDLILNEDLNRGLALASGGARGAYQAGAMLALAERNIKFSHIAGTSIGTLNGAFYVQGSGSIRDMNNLCSLWREIGKINLIKPNVELLKKGIKPFKKGFSIFDHKSIENTLDKYLDYEKICKSSKKFIITTIPSIDPITDILIGTFQNTRYFHANQISPLILKKALLAATAIPIAFPSVDINGSHFTDAGLSTPLPSKVIADCGVNFIVSIFLSDTIIQNRTDYNDSKIFQIRPSSNIAKSFFSMLDFNSSTIDYLLELGYSDANNSLKRVGELQKPLLQIKENKDELDKLMDEFPKD